MIIPILTGLLIGLRRQPKKRKNMEELAKAAILAVSKKYGQDAAMILEKLYRLETDHFKSRNFAEAKGAGATNRAVDQKIKAVNLGYNLGPVALAAGYARNEDAGGNAGADNDVFMLRLLGAF
jgi:hypothetical protein